MTPLLECKSQFENIEYEDCACDLMHSQFTIEGSLYRLYSETSVGTPNCKQTELN